MTKTRNFVPAVLAGLALGLAPGTARADFVSTSGLGAPPSPGALFRIDAVTGVRTQIPVDGLFFPTGLAVGPDGSLYVSNFGTSAGGGQVLRVPAAVPEPTTLTLLGVGTLGLSCYGRCRRKYPLAAGRAAG